MKSSTGRRPGSGDGPDSSFAEQENPSRGRPRAAGDTLARTRQISLGGLDQFTGYVVRRAQVWIFQDFKRALKDSDITPAQFSVMKVVAANPGIVQARVAEVLAIERARLVQMLDRLEARQLIARARTLNDRRSHALHLTQDGAALLEHLERLIAQHEQNVVARIGAKDKGELLRILGFLLR